MDQDTKKMVKQTITYDDGTETVINYTSLGEKVEGPAVEPEVPAFGEKTCGICGCKMAGPGVTEDMECAEVANHPKDEGTEQHYQVR